MVDSDLGRTDSLLGMVNSLLGSVILFWAELTLFWAGLFPIFLKQEWFSFRRIGSGRVEFLSYKVDSLFGAELTLFWVRLFLYWAIICKESIFAWKPVF